MGPIQLKPAMSNSPMSAMISEWNAIAYRLPGKTMSGHTFWSATVCMDCSSSESKNSGGEQNLGDAKSTGGGRAGCAAYDDARSAVAGGGVDGRGLDDELDVPGGGESDCRAEAVPSGCARCAGDDDDDAVEPCFDAVRRSAAASRLTDAGEWSSRAMGVASRPCRKLA